MVDSTTAGVDHAQTARLVGVLALEASVVSNVISTFRQTLPNVVSSLRDRVSQLLSFNQEHDLAQEIRSLYQSQNSKISSVGVVQHANLLLTVPQGFEGPYVPYLEALHKIGDALHSKLDRLMGDYELVLSAFVSDKASKTALSDHTRLYKGLSKEREQIGNDIGAFFPKESRELYQYGQLYPQTSDVGKAVKAAEVLAPYQKGKRLQNLKDATARCVNLLDLVSNQVADPTAVVSGPAALDLSSGAQEVGQWVALAAAYHYRVEEALQNLKNHLDRLAKAGA